MRILTLPVVLSAALVSTSALASKTTFQHVSGAYGSVAYSADVTCEAAGDTYTVVVSTLHLAFQPNTNVNKVDSVRNPRLRLITTVLRPGATRANLTSETSLPLALTLDKDHLEATANALRFMVAKMKVKESTYTVLDLTDGHMLWPFAESLKPCALSSDSSLEADESAGAQIPH